MITRYPNLSNQYEPEFNYIGVHLCIDDYIDVPDYEFWEACPNCNLVPKIWVFNNGRSTACGCGKNKYNHFSIYAESIMSHYNRCGNVADYNCDQLRLNWNRWCLSGEVTFDKYGPFKEDCEMREMW